MKYLITLCAAIVFLSGCSSRPPACGDEQAMDAVKNLIIKEVRKPLTEGTEYKADPAPMDAFFNTLKLTISMVTTDGYNEKAKKHVCHGQLAVAVGDQQGKFDIDYSTQNMEDKRGDFIVQIEQGQFVINQIKNTGFQLWYAQRFSGTWQGIYSCDGIDGELSGNRAGYKQETTMTVADSGKAKLERTTRGGGIEQLSGTIDPLGKIELAGRGKNTPDDTWMTYFSGEAKSTELFAKGRITDSNGDRTLRTCQLQLKRTVTDFKTAANSASGK